MKHKLTALCLAAALLCAVSLPAVEVPGFTVSAAANTCGEALTWTLDSDGVLTISGRGVMDNWDGSTARPPWYASRDRIKKVVLNTGVETVGSYAFSGCGNLTDAVLPSGLHTIGDRAFCQCTALAAINVPGSLRSVGGMAFSGTAILQKQMQKTPLVILNSIVIDGSTVEGECRIPDTVKAIAPGAFSLNGRLTAVTLPAGITEIGDDTFSFCKGLTAVTIPDSVTAIGSGAFIHCESLAEVHLSTSLETIGPQAFEYCKSLKTLELPYRLTSISARAFRYSGIQEILIPSKVKEIGLDAFYGCDALTRVGIKSPGCRIYSSADTFADSSGAFSGTIYGYTNSTADMYARKYGRAFVSLGEVPVFILGDVNGDKLVNASDAAWILRAAAMEGTSGGNPLSPEAQDAADVDRSGSMNASDAALVLMYAAAVGTGFTGSIETYLSWRS